MALNWINVEDYSFNRLLLMERFQIRLFCAIEDKGWKSSLGTALTHHPDIVWYLVHRCPECEAYIQRVMADAARTDDPHIVRQCELSVLRTIEDFVIHTKPEEMEKCCKYIYGWNEERLFELADFTGKRVLDVGAGSGRLTFAAARRAAEVYAVEPVGTLREFMLDKIVREGIGNVRVTDGLVDRLPYPDDTFDIVMSGHVVGDDYGHEIAELTRVTRNGGWILDCPGEDDRKREPDRYMREHGWEEFYYKSCFDGHVYRYRKQIVK